MEGNEITCKARLVEKDIIKMQGIDFDETFSSGAA